MIGWEAYPEERDSDVRGSGPILASNEERFEFPRGML
jgi:hypothetical protein